VGNIGMYSRSEKLALEARSGRCNTCHPDLDGQRIQLSVEWGLYGDIIQRSMEYVSMDSQESILCESPHITRIVALVGAIGFERRAI